MFVEVGDDGVGPSGLDQDVINVDLEVPANLFF